MPHLEDINRVRNERQVAQCQLMQELTQAMLESRGAPTPPAVLSCRSHLGRLQVD